MKKIIRATPAQQDLLSWREEPRARRTDPATSHIAASRVKASGLRDRIVSHLLEVGGNGATTEEMAQAGIGLLQSITPRMKELERRGIAVKLACVYRRGLSGSPREVWVARTVLDE